MGLIKIENMEFYAYHGHFEEEQVVGNKFLVDLELQTNMSAPAKSDQLKDALNYQTAYELVKEQMKHPSHLLEHVASRILDALYAHFDALERAEVKVSKMNPPMGGKMERVSVTLWR